MPNNEMMKFRQRKGWRLSCGWLPPVGTIALAFIGTVGGATVYGTTLSDMAGTRPEGLIWLPGAPWITPKE